MDLIEGSETSAKLNLTPWRHPKEHTQEQNYHLIKIMLLDFRLSLCSVLTVSIFGCFPSVWFILADVSDPSVRSIFKGLKPLKTDLTEGSETSAYINQTLGKHPKVDTVKK
jgi:hypothetical protein